MIRRSPENELRARVGAARRIAELEAVLRIALIENRKLSTTDDLTRVASRRFFSKHFPRETERAARRAQDSGAHAEGGGRGSVPEQTRRTQPRDGHEAHQRLPLNRRPARVGENSRTLTQPFGVVVL